MFPIARSTKGTTDFAPFRDSPGRSSETAAAAQPYTNSCGLLKQPYKQEIASRLLSGRSAANPNLQPTVELARISLTVTGSPVEGLTRSAVPSLHSDRHYVARSSQVNQANGNSGSRRNAIREPEVHLTITSVTGSIAEVLYFG